MNINCLEPGAIIVSKAAPKVPCNVLCVDDNEVHLLIRGELYKKPRYVEETKELPAFTLAAVGGGPTNIAPVIEGMVYDRAADSNYYASAVRGVMHHAHCTNGIITGVVLLTRANTFTYVSVDYFYNGKITVTEKVDVFERDYVLLQFAQPLPEPPSPKPTDDATDLLIQAGDKYWRVRKQGDTFYVLGRHEDGDIQALVTLTLIGAVASRMTTVTASLTDKLIQRLHYLFGWEPF